MSSLLQAYLQQFKLKDTADGSFAAVTSAAAAAAADAETVVVGTRSLPVEHCSTVRNPENQSDNGDVEWTDEQLKQMFLYRVPVTTDDGSCSASKEVAPEPFDLGRELFGTEQWYDTARNSTVTGTVAALRRVVDKLQQKTGVDWLGVYRLRTATTSSGNAASYLVKIAYYGRLSRAIFPLNEVFHDISNNSWVAMEGTAKLIQNVATYTGPYYACDGEVQSELCAPIFGQDGQVVGIIDAESFNAQFFDDNKIADILSVCAAIGASDLLSTL